MQALAEWTEHTRAEYRDTVNDLLWTRCGATVDSLNAESVVQACQLAGLSPLECFCWLVNAGL